MYFDTSAFKIIIRWRWLNNGKQQEESIHFTHETATETPYTVQGSGRTYLAKSLVNDLQNDGKIEEGILICSLNDLIWGPWEK